MGAGNFWSLGAGRGKVLPRRVGGASVEVILTPVEGCASTLHVELL